MQRRSSVHLLALSVLALFARAPLLTAQRAQPTTSSPAKADSRLHASLPEDWLEQINVDPLVTNEAWSAESNQDGARFGQSVSSAGDVNGDGYDDVIVGAPTYDNGELDEGRAYAYHGSATGLGPAEAWTAESNQPIAFFGRSVSGAGDVNGDGYSDVIVGAYLYSNGEEDEGRAYVYHGSAAGLGATEAWSVESNVEDALFGCSVSSAGDVNGDGYSDVIVGARGYDSVMYLDLGRVYVYHGSAVGLDTTEAWIAEASRSGTGLGSSVSSAGDVNADGYGDIVVGTLVDSARVYHGSATGLSATQAWIGNPNQGNCRFGSSVSSAGDVNGDGYSDVVIGANSYDNGQSNEGRAYVYHGSAAGVATAEAWTAESNQAAALFGVSVSSAGDVNGDGYSDVIAGAYYYDNGESEEGRAYAYHGSATGLGAITAAAVGWRNAGSNPSSYVAGLPVLGQAWNASVDLTGTGHTHAQVLGFRAGSSGPTLPGGQTLLVAGPRYFGLPLRVGPTANWSVPLPNDPSFCGITIYTQAVHLLGATPYVLSNAQDLLIGF